MAAHNPITLYDPDLRIVTVDRTGAYVEHTPSGFAYLATEYKSLLKNKARALQEIRERLTTQQQMLQQYAAEVLVRSPAESTKYNVHTNDPVSAVATIVPQLKADLHSVGTFAGRCLDGSSFRFRFKR